MAFPTTSQSISLRQIKEAYATIGVTLSSESIGALNGLTYYDSSIVQHTIAASSGNSFGIGTLRGCIVKDTRPIEQTYTTFDLAVRPPNNGLIPVSFHAYIVGGSGGGGGGSGAYENPFNPGANANGGKGGDGGYGGINYSLTAAYLAGYAFSVYPGAGGTGGAGGNGNNVIGPAPFYTVYNDAQNGTSGGDGSNSILIYIDTTYTANGGKGGGWASAAGPNNPGGAGTAGSNGDGSDTGGGGTGGSGGIADGDRTGKIGADGAGGYIKITWYYT